MHPIKRVVCGVSGGVDSCVSAFLLKKKGFDVIGSFMRNWDTTDETGHCQSNKDCADAEEICKRLGIPFHEVEFVKDYWNDVFTPMVQDYQDGLTPNPDVSCNKYIKFSKFLNYAREKHGADAIATGHYARTSFGPFLENRKIGETVKLLKGTDPLKDQTLFLSQVSQEALHNTMFPVGEMLKKHVKGWARHLKFNNIVSKEESTGICFIGKRKFADFMKGYSESKPGRFVDVDTGKIVGRHDGVQFFTYGQRALIGGLSAAYYIVYKNPRTQDVIVALGHNNDALYSSTLTVTGMHWISGIPDDLAELQCDFRYQHGRPVISCKLDFTNSDDTKTQFSVALRDRQFAVTPGQYAVFYDGDQCLGSGRIAFTEKSVLFSEIVPGTEWQPPAEQIPLFN